MAEHESVTNFTERVKTQMTTYWNTISPTGEPVYHTLAAESAKACTGTQAPKDDKEKARQALLAYIIIEKSNNKWFGDLKKELQGNQLQDVGKYPETVAKAMEFLHNYERQNNRNKDWTNRNNTNNTKNGNNDRNTNCTPETPQAFSCSYPITGAVWSVGVEPVMKLKVNVPSTLSL